jgi:hypothetical protein
MTKGTRPRSGAQFIVVGLVVTLLLAACGSTGPSSQPSATPEGTVPAPSPSASATSAVMPASPVAARDTPLMGPTGLVFDAAGNLYVSECQWRYAAIHRIDPHGMITSFAGTGGPGYTGDGGPATAAQLYCPTGMAFGPDGAMYFADHANNRIRHIDAAGIITTVAGSRPTGVDMGSFSGDGGPAIQATLQEPWGVAFDAAGNLFIGDRDNRRVRRVDPSGVITTVAGNGKYGFSGDGGPAIGAMVCPLGIAVDPAGKLLIADQCNDRVRSVDGHGVISTIAGTGDRGLAGDGGPAALAAVEAPGHLAFGGGGALFVQSGLRIRQIDSSGIITTIAGGGTAALLDDGMAALQVQFGDIYGLAVDAIGNIYVAEQTTNSVYRIDIKGILTRFAGKPS